MRLATLRTAGGMRAVRVDADRAIEVGSDDVGAPPSAAKAIDSRNRFAVAVGATGRHADESVAEAAIAAYAVLDETTTIAGSGECRKISVMEKSA